MSTGGTCGVGCVLGDPPLVVVLGVALVNGMKALWEAPSEVLGGLEPLYSNGNCIVA